MNLAKYIGKSYEEYDCFDLVRDFYADHMDLDLRRFYEGGQIDNKQLVQSLIISNKGHFERVDVPKPGDIMVINLFGYACHIGVYVGGGRFLHSIKRTGSVLDNVSRYTKMIEGFYRHRETAP